MTINCLFLEVFYCNCQFIAHVSIVAGSKTMCTAIASMSQLFGVPTRNSCCYSKAGSSQSTIRVGKYFWQLFQVWRSYSECLLGIDVAIPGRATGPYALLELLHQSKWEKIWSTIWFVGFEFIWGKVFGNLNWNSYFSVNFNLSETCVYILLMY